MKFEYGTEFMAQILVQFFSFNSQICWIQVIIRQYLQNKIGIPNNFLNILIFRSVMENSTQQQNTSFYGRQKSNQQSQEQQNDDQQSEEAQRIDEDQVNHQPQPELNSNRVIDQQNPVVSVDDAVLQEATMTSLPAPKKGLQGIFSKNNPAVDPAILVATGTNLQADTSETGLLNNQDESSGNSKPTLINRSKTHMTATRNNDDETTEELLLPPLKIGGNRFNSLQGPTYDKLDNNAESTDRQEDHQDDSLSFVPVAQKKPTITELIQETSNQVKNRKFAGFSQEMQGHMKKKTAEFIENSFKKEIQSRISLKGRKSSNTGSETEESGQDSKVNQSFAKGVSDLMTATNKNNRDLRGKFLSQYGVFIEFPAYYQYQAKFVPNQQYILTLGNHSIPQNATNRVQTTYETGEYDEQTYYQIYQDNIGMLLNLQQPEGRQGFKQIKQVRLSECYKDAMVHFSKSGEFLSIVLKKQRKHKLDNLGQVMIYKSSDVINCMENVEKEEALFSPSLEFDDFGEFGTPQIVKFDPQDQFIAIASLKNLAIFDLENGQLKQKYKIDPDLYMGIHDILLDSTYFKGNQYPFKCHLACKMTGLNTIMIYDINERNGTKKKVSYFKKGTSNQLVVQILEDFERVIVSNGLEHYVHNGVHQQLITSFKDKVLRHVVQDGNEQYFVTSKDYDRDIDILKANEPEFNASMKRISEPKLLKVADSLIIEEGDRRLMKLLTIMDDQIFLDTIDLKIAQENEDPEESVISTCRDMHYSAFGFNWPYFSFASKNNELFILNSFNPDFVQRYLFPENISRICQTFLSDSSDLYCMCETYDDHFEMYQIDLDDESPELKGPLKRYSFESVDNKELVQFHCRSSSIKDKINLNKLLITFMTHGTTLYFWNGHGLKKIDDDTYNLQYQSDDEVFYLTTRDSNPIIRSGDNKVIQHSAIYQLQALFGYYRSTKVYEAKNTKAEILSFEVDNTRRRLVILTGIKNSQSRRDKFITIFDYEGEKILFNLRVEDREIIGRLKSNLYSFVDGHIYYGNNVIKLRYDQVDKQGGFNLQEKELFDKYEDILSLGSEDNVIQSGTPLKTCMYNRLAYIIRNPTDQLPRKIMILPYLHERKIMLNRRLSANQFYTIFEEYDDFLKKANRYILCFCISDSKIYVYTETGILKSTIFYNHFDEMYGKPVAMSENANYFIFRKSDSNKEAHLVNVTSRELKHIQLLDIKQRITSYIDKIDDFQRKDKMLEFWDQYLEQLEKPNHLEIDIQLNDNGDVLMRIKPKFQYFKEIQQKKTGQLYRNISMASMTRRSSSLSRKKKGIVDKITDGCLKKNEEKVDDETYLGYEINSFFFFFANPNGGKKNKDYLYFDGEDDTVYEFKGCSMNQKYIFFWNQGKIWKLNIEKQDGITELPLYIDRNEQQTFVKSVRCGSNDDITSIVVAQSPTLDCVIVWDLDKNLEKTCLDVAQDALFFQDRNGTPHIAQEDYIVNCSQGCKMKAYAVRVEDFNIENVDFGFETGHRVDMKNQNYMVFRNFINLSFSYMSFVIKDNFDKSGFVNEDFLFDIEGYDFIINKKNIFFEGDLVKLHYDKMKFILQNYEQIDPRLLETLHFSYDYGNDDEDQGSQSFIHYTKSKVKDKLQGPCIPLHLALQANNNRMVNLILNYMSKLEFATVNLIKNIFKDLINFHDFQLYLTNSPFQTMQMLKKQTFRINSEPIDEEIIRISGHFCSYVDDVFFKECMGEAQFDPSSKVYGSDVVCVQADWILNEDQGKHFLHELINTRNNDIFKVPYVKIIVQFLYEQYRSQIMKYLLPLYLAQFLMILIYIILESSEEIDGRDIQKEDVTHEIKTIVLIIGFVFTFFNTIVFVRQSIDLGFNIVAGRFWSLIDLAIILTNLVICSKVILEFDTITMRYFEALCIVCMMMKSLYFFRLIGEIAPLVDIIFVILEDIKSFMVIYIVALVAFIIAYFVIGRNQKQIELEEWISNGSVAEDEPQGPEYSTLLGSTIHVYKASMGSFGHDDYVRNGGLITGFMLFLAFILSFFMCIHMLNMLIAIMGDSFSRNHEQKEQRKKMSQLQFVVDNWWIEAINDKENIVYIIAACQNEEVQQDQEKFEKMNSKINELSKNVHDINGNIRELGNNMGAIMTELKNIQTQNSRILDTQKD